MLPITTRISQLENDIVRLNRDIHDVESHLSDLEWKRECKEEELRKLEDQRDNWTEEEWEAEQEAIRQKHLLEQRYGIARPVSIADWWTNYANAAR